MEIGCQEKMKPKHIRQARTATHTPVSYTHLDVYKRQIENMMDFADKMSPLGNAVAEDCANYCVMMFSDFTRKVTTVSYTHLTMTHNLLKGKRGIIFGALNEESIAWKVAVKAAEEGEIGRAHV